MNITFILGNGFDIGLKLKTSYSDFYDNYCELEEDKDDENIKSFKNTLLKWKNERKESVVDWSDFEKAFGEHSNDFKIENKHDYINRFEDFVQKFNVYLEDEEKNADYSKTDLISKTMKTAITTYYDIQDEDKETIQRIYNSDGGMRTYNFVTFNYTKSIDNCAEILKNSIKNDSRKDIGRIVHIHGYIEENMIMGVNDSTQILNEDFANDKDIVDEIVKPNQNRDMKANYEKQFINVINSSNIICIYGMSIGETDKKWWKQIAEWLSNSERRILVILKYDTNYDKRFTFKRRKSVNTVKSRFLELCEQTDEIKDKISSRILVGMNHNVFEMNLRKESESN